MCFKRILFLLFSFHIAIQSIAVDEIRNSRLEANSIAVGKTLMVKDDKFPAFFVSGWDNNFANMKNTGKIEFGIDENKHAFYSSDFSVEITFDVIATNKFNQQQIFSGRKLKVDYKKSGVYLDKAQLVFDGYVKLELSITNIDSRNLPSGAAIATPKELFLEAEIATVRNYLFYTNTSPNTNSNSLNWKVINPCSLGTPPELEIYWDYVPGVEEYELEWTWVNDYFGTAPKYDFRFDATRIITKNTFYRIPLTYEHGFIVYRLRHIGRGGALFNQRVEGVWTNYPENGIVSNYPANMKYNVSSFSSDNINWSSTFTFDENGRKGSGVSFMDGMLMGRQSLAKLNTANKVLAQSVIYDFQGRPAISILPAPVNSECLVYQNGLNYNSTGANYNQTNFDDDGTNNCESTIDPINVINGASNYYSTSNINKEGPQGYLPVADGLPFVQVEYTNDMTGRIKSQSMPGEAHKLGDGKETTFYYSNPGDGELYQLFGSEVGNANHYDKNIVRDANGQLSSSYIDMEGRVVATSLLGPKPASVDGIADYNSSIPLLDKMDKYNTIDYDNYTITSTKNIFIEQAGSVQTFTYEFMPEDVYEVCAPTVCFDCIYELDFTITDACNSNITAPVSVLVGTLAHTKFEINNCENPSIKYEISPGGPLTVVFPEVGNYVITKTLRVSDKYLDKYIESYIANNRCFDNYEKILQDQINAIDFSSCNTDCQSCSTSVASYITNYPSTHNGNTLTSVEINLLYQECSNLCLDQLDPCFLKRQQMLQDFYPGGQYAGYSVSAAGVYSSSGSTSILSASNVLNVTYKDCSLNYVDANGVGNVMVDIYRAGQLVTLKVCSLTVEEFVHNFQPSWANVFLNRHPEMCYLTFCEDNKESDKYDFGMMQVNSYDEAYSKGYLKPLPGLTVPGQACQGTPAASKLDPFFSVYTNGTNGPGNVTTINNVVRLSGFNTYKDLMLNYFANYPEDSNPVSWVTLFDAAKVMGGSTTGNAFGCDPCTKDKEWLAFRSLYLAQKMRVVAQAKTDYVMEHGCFNGCMQNSGLQPFTPKATAFSHPFTSLNFLKGNFAYISFPSSPQYEYYTLTGYPITKIPFVPSGLWYDEFFHSVNNGEVHACSANAGGAFDSKIAHFQQLPFDANGLITYYNDILNPGSGSNVLPGSVTIPPAANTTNNYCLSTCQSYAEQWITKLKDCNPIFDVANQAVFNLPANVTIRNQIMAELVNVCKNGCDAQNPFGASTTNPGLATTPAFTSFQQVITHFSGIYPSIISNPNSAGCSYLNLDFPSPYNHDYSGAGNGAQNTLDTCGCNKILSTRVKYNELALNGTLPTGVTTVEQYFEYRYNISIVNFNELECKCSSTAPTWYSTYQWTNAQSLELLSTNFPVPEILSCTKCIPCSTLRTVITNFNELNQDLIGVPNYNELLGTYLSSTLNMNLSPNEYLDFYNNNCLTGSNNINLPAQVQMLNFLNVHLQIYNAASNSAYDYSDYPPIFGSAISPCTDNTNQNVRVNSFIIAPIIFPYLNFPYDFANAMYLFYGGSNLSMNPHNNEPAGNDCYRFPCALKLVNEPSAAILASNFLFTGVSFNLPSPYNSTNNFSANYQYTDVNNIIQSGILYGYYSCLNIYPPIIESQPLLCNKPFSQTLPIYEDCMSSMLNQAETNAHLIYQSYVDKFTAEFTKNYYRKCLKVKEKYERKYSINEYHYTLYYYDQAGSLVRTVSPKGVHKLSAADVALLQGQTPPVIFPSHTYVTNYKYQTYGAPISSNTPDEQYKVDPTTCAPAVTQYLYDNIGRIQVSFNGQQRIDGKYSYTLYDELGRIKEVGVLGNIPASITLQHIINAIAINGFENFINTLPSPTQRTEVINTYYDFPLNGAISNQFGPGGQVNLRNRVVTVTYEDVYDGNINTYNYATHYTYDVHGNVGKLIQDMPALSQLGKRFNKIDYEYDLISGNVNKVVYQKGSPDQFMHRYEYDDDNRLHNVYTSKDNINWDRDAKYFYYEHGPLARTEIGDQKVQGTDFAYTIHGWIKAVNSNILSENADIGKDGAQGNRYISDQHNVHQFIGKDATGYSLNYYQQNGLVDYRAIKSFNGVKNMNMLANLSHISNAGTPFNLSDDAPDLYNGNISSMVTSIFDMDINLNNTHAENTAFPQITGYKYDQLHRLKQMKAFRDLSLNTNQWNGASAGNYDGSYLTNLTYDKNGNILSQQRDGAAFVTNMGLSMDNMTYKIEDGSSTIPNNKLIGVSDVSPSNYFYDIKGTSNALDCDQSSYDYNYNAIGSLISDKKEFIQNIEWTVDRKVKRITRNGPLMAAASKNMADLEFEYDANRQRTVKIVKPHAPTGSLMDQDSWVYTYYVRDASGNITATYTKTYAHASGQSNHYIETIKLQEHDIYGSARLGTIPNDLIVGNRSFTANMSNGLFQNINYLTQGINTDVLCTISVNLPTGEILLMPCPVNYSRILGNKRYELTNHLGNVLSVVSDRKIQQPGNTIDLQNDYELPFNFQSLLPVSNSGGGTYCAKLNNGFSPNITQEVQVGDVVTASVEYYKTGTATGLLVLSITDEYGHFLYDNDNTDVASGVLWLPNSVTTNASWQSLSISKTIYPVFSDAAKTIPYTGRIFINSHEWNPNSNDCWFDNHSIHIAQATPMVSNYKAEILETHDYYAFGMEMPGRRTPPPGSIGQYPYGMNGQMKEGDAFEGFMSADYWAYDARLGRRWEMDPLDCPWQSPYATFDNSPIVFSDPSGLQAEGNGDGPDKKKKRQDPVPERETRRDNIPQTGKDKNPQISKAFPESPVHLNIIPNSEVECMEGVVEQGFTIIGNTMRFAQGLETGETWESLYGLAKFAGSYISDRNVRINFAFSTANAIENHFLEYSPNTLGKDMVNVAAVIAPFALKAPVAMEVPMYEPGLISYEGFGTAIGRGSYVEELMVNDLNQLYPNLKVMKQARIKFEGYSATMKADIVLIEETSQGPVIRIIGESKYNGAVFSEGQKLLYIHKEYAILVGKNGEELMYFNPDAIELLEYRFMPEGTYNITPY